MWFTVLTNLAGTPNSDAQNSDASMEIHGMFGLDLLHDFADPCGTLGPWMALVPHGTVTSPFNLAAVPINLVIPCHSSMF